MVNRGYGGRGHRNMYYQTGLPGWMRFGYSPGWQGRSPTGLGPAASFLKTGRWPTPPAQGYRQTMGPGPVPGATYGVPSAPQVTKEQEFGVLQSQARSIKSQLEQIEARIAELETEAQE